MNDGKQDQGWFALKVAARARWEGVMCERRGRGGEACVEGAGGRAAAGGQVGNGRCRKGGAWGEKNSGRRGRQNDEAPMSKSRRKKAVEGL